MKNRLSGLKLCPERMSLFFFFPDETEKEKVVEHITCPHKVKNTPWISFKNSCYTFMVTNDRWRELRSQEAHHLCKKMSKYFILRINFFIFTFVLLCMKSFRSYTYRGMFK